MEILLEIAFALSFSTLVNFCRADPLLLLLVSTYQCQIADHIMRTELLWMRGLYMNYAPPRAPNGPPTTTLDYVYWIHRRYKTAERLATTIGAASFEPISQKKLRKLHEYLVLLTHYLETCRLGLMNYPPNPLNPNDNVTPFVNTEMNILRNYQTSYSNQDLVRLCGLYKLVYQLLEAVLHAHGTDTGFAEARMAGHIRINVPQLLFIGGGEATLDCLTPIHPGTRLQYFMSHLRRAHVLTATQFKDVANIPLGNPTVPVLSPIAAAWVQWLLPGTGRSTIPLVPSILYGRGMNCFAASRTVNPLDEFMDYVNSEDVEV